MFRSSRNQKHCLVARDVYPPPRAAHATGVLTWHRAQFRQHSLWRPSWCDGQVRPHRLIPIDVKSRNVRSQSLSGTQTSPFTAGVVLVCNAVAVVAMLVALTQHDGLVIDATLRHYLARDTASGARDEALSRLHSSYSTVRHPPLSFRSTSSVRAFSDSLEHARSQSTMSGIPRSTLHAFLSPPKSTLERTTRGDVAAGILGDSGADELHVLVKVEGKGGLGFGDDYKNSSTVFDQPPVESMCELKRRIEHTPGYTQVCRHKDGYDEASDVTTDASTDENISENEKTENEIAKICHSSFSIFDVHAVYSSIGLGNVLDSLSKFGKKLNQPQHSNAFQRASQLCAETASDGNIRAGAILCEDLFFSKHCDPRGCSTSIRPSQRACIIGKFVEACGLVSVAQESDVNVLADVYDNVRMGKQLDRETLECASNELKSTVDINLRFGEMVNRWAERERESDTAETSEIDSITSILSPLPMATLAAPWTLLVDRNTFSDRAIGHDGSETQSSNIQSSRLVFFTRRGASGSVTIDNDDITPTVRWVIDTVGSYIIEPFPKALHGTSHGPLHGTYKTQDSMPSTRRITASWEHLRAQKALQTSALWRDVRWAGGSLLVTAFAVCVHSGDMRLAMGAITFVTASLIPAIFIYVFVCKISWIGALHFLGCFVIFAIGADDAFVLMEFWRKAEEYCECGGVDGVDVRDVDILDTVGRIRHTVDSAGHAVDDNVGDNESQKKSQISRMRWTVSKSGYAVTTTSVTTALAFAGNLSSPIIPIRLFGIYMTLLVMSNYYLICTSFPALLVLSERRKAALERRKERERKEFVDESETLTAAPLTAAPASPPASPQVSPPVSPSTTPSAPPLLPPPPTTSILVTRSSSVRGIPASTRHRRTRSTVTFSTPRRGRIDERAVTHDDTLHAPVVSSFSSVLRCSKEKHAKPMRATTHEPFHKTVVGYPAVRRSVSLNSIYDHARINLAVRFSPNVSSGDVVLDFGSDDDFGTPRSTFIRFSGTDDEIINGQGHVQVVHSGDTTHAYQTYARRLSKLIQRSAKHFCAFTTSTFGSRFVVLVAFVCVIYAIVVAQAAKPPDMATTTVSSFVESENAKTFRDVSQSFSISDVTNANCVTFVFGVQDVGRAYEHASIGAESQVIIDTADPASDASFETRVSSLLKSTHKSLANIFQPLQSPDLAVGGGGNSVAASPPKFDMKFDLADREAQVWMLRFCQELRQLMGTKVHSLTCFVEVMDARLKAESGGKKQLPLESDDFLSAASINSYQGYGVTGVRWWREHDKDLPNLSKQMVKGSNLPISPISSLEVSIVTKTSTSFTKTSVLKKERLFWQRFFELQMRSAPVSITGFVTSRTWVLLDTEYELNKSAWVGLTSSLVCAFVVVLVASKSFRLAVLATLSVGAVASSFVAFLVQNNLKMGVSESVCVTVLVGLSLDYVLHVAGSYKQAPSSYKSDRRKRSKWALKTTGGSVFMGASTTLAAASFLVWRCDGDFFQTFGKFVLWTTGVSGVFAVTVFPASVALWGPVG